MTVTVGELGLQRAPQDATTTSSTAVAARPKPRRPREPLWLSAAALCIYLAAAAAMAQANFAFGDNYARVANAYYVLFSGDPHLAAVGFVWTPLPSLVLLPLLPFKALFPALVTHAFAGAIQSAVCMAASVGVLTSCLNKMGVARGPRIAVAALFALQPMLLIYGGSGESEPMLILFLLLTTRALLTWWQGDGKCGALVLAGMFLGIAYMARYEAGAAAVAVTVLVAIVTLRRTPGGRRFRIGTVVNDAMLVAGPFLFVFALWAGCSKLIVGSWFPTFTSKYGNSAQVGWQSIGSQIGTGPFARLGFALEQTVVLAPLLTILLAVALTLAARRRDGRIAAALCVFCAIVVFNAGVLVAGGSFGWLRFQIYVIPLAALCAGAVIAMTHAPAGRARTAAAPDAANPRPARAPTRRFSPVILAALVAIAVAYPVQALVLTDPSLQLAREEAPRLSAALSPDSAAAQSGALRQFVTERKVATYLDGMELPAGTVLTDSGAAFAVILASDRPGQFVIPSDRDFDDVLAHPAASGIRYVLISDGRGDALRSLPRTLSTDTGSLAAVRHWAGVPQYGYPSWDLYRLTGG